ncbi:MAG: glycosyltransferase family 2 protein [Leptolyngbya sp. PLA3]|nr:glycosyltransferase family 2 protein [Leptolyngbya sp. PL-A3]
MQAAYPADRPGADRRRRVDSTLRAVHHLGMTLPLSIATVCRNNRQTMERVLESVAGLAGEVVAVDSGSTDGTLELLSACGARVIETQWKGHVATKQMALEACELEWILHLDSDEPVEPALAASIRAFIDRREPGVAGARVNRKIWYRGRLLEHAWQPEWRLRLVRREHVIAGLARWAGADPHDRLDVDARAGRVVDLPGTLRHESFVTFAEHLGKQLALSRIAAESMHRAGQRGSLLRLIGSPPGAMFKQVVLKQGWRDGIPGWLAGGTAAAGALMKHLILLELGEKSPDGPGA